MSEIAWKKAEDYMRLHKISDEEIRICLCGFDLLDALENVVIAFSGTDNTIGVRQSALKKAAEAVKKARGGDRAKVV